MKLSLLSIMYSLLILSTLYGEVAIGADVVSRYVWRGTDYGNSVSIQPSIEGEVGRLTVGAWSSFPLTDAIGTSKTAGNECDLYVSTSLGPISITLTDYFFPAYAETDSLFNLDKHIFELSASGYVGQISLLGAANLSGDKDNSTYFELTYATFSLGLGNGAYTTDGKFAPVSIGISASRDNFSASYIINPDKETSFLVFGVNF